MSTDLDIYLLEDSLVSVMAGRSGGWLRTG
jgi:hypothetical protein